MNQNMKVRFGRIKKSLICIGLFLFMAGMAMTPFGFALAQERLIRLEMDFPDYYPYGFHGMGTILSIERDRVVIDDKGFALSSAVTYHTLEIEHASSAFFRPGKRVGYLFDSERRIKSLWMIEE
jgi:hypothetical protein